jgi:electron transfer flavoprotein alpha subunit
MSEILVFCEKKETAFELVSQAAKFKDSLQASLAALIVDENPSATADEFFGYGADKVYIVNSNNPSEGRADIYMAAIAQVVNTYPISTLFLGSTKAGKQIAPMIAQSLGAGCVTDAIDIRILDGEISIDRYSLGGSTVATLVIKTPKKVITVMPKTFTLGAKVANKGNAISVTLPAGSVKLKVLEKQPKTGESVPIEEAETLICVGRGLGDRNGIPMIEDLAKVLKGEIGATRPLTHDWHWFHESREVGLSGKKCKPRLCLSLGVSGQIQHTVGIRDSKIIMTINKDKNAPIFKVADYGLVADLYEVVPRLTKLLQSSQ